MRRGDILNIVGYSAPAAEVNLTVNSETAIQKKIPAGGDGAWLYKLDSDLLEYGDHSTYANAVVTSDISKNSHTVSFKVGENNIAAAPPSRCPQKGDLNGDCRVNLVDFSILAYWYKRPSPPPKMDLNGDVKVDIADFSIMVYYWTG